MARRTRSETTKGPSPNQWAEIRDIFTDLWIEQEKSLKEVQYLLHKKHGFAATERMYKRRVRQWGLCKYCKERDILPLLVLIARRRQAGKHTLIWNRRDIFDFAEVRRYIRRKKITNLQERIEQAGDDEVVLPSYLRCTTPDSSYEPDGEDEHWWSAIESPQDPEDIQSQLVLRNGPSPVSLLILPDLNPPGELVHMDHLLYASSTFFSPFSPEIICTNIRIDLLYSLELQEFEGHLHHAALFADLAEWKNMRSSYGKAMDLVPTIMRGNQSLNFLICLFVILACCKTHRRLILVPTILCFIAHSAANNLPANHPFCQIIYALHKALPPHNSSSHSFCSSSASTTSNCGIGTPTNTPPPTPPDPQLIPYLVELSLRTALTSLLALDAHFDPRARIVAYGLFETLFATGQYVSARALIRDTWRKEEEWLGRRSSLTLWSMMAAGRCEIELGDLSEGEKVLGEVVGIVGDGDDLFDIGEDWVMVHVRECALLNRRSCVHRKRVKEVLQEQGGI